MSRTIRAFPFGCEDHWKFGTDNISRQAIKISSEYELLGEHYGPDLWGEGKTKEKKRLRRRDRKRTRQHLRMDITEE
jgi:hypothetical protein